MLRHLGIEADAAPDGTAAVERASARPYDLVLLGVRDGETGSAVCDAIRAQRPAGVLRIVAVSDHEGPGAADRLQAAGFDGVIHKPLSVAALDRAVRTPAAGDGAPGAPPAPGASEPGAAAADDDAASLLRDVRAHVRSLLGEDDEEFVAELAEAFVGSSQQALDAAVAARERGDAAGVASAAHALKGSASNVGLKALTEAWSDVETGTRLGDPSALDGPFATAVAETERALDQFSTIVGG